MEGKVLGKDPVLHREVRIKDSVIGEWTEIGEKTDIVESSIGDYSYCAGYNSIYYTELGKFCSIATYVRINPGNHPMERVIQHHCTYRRRQYGFCDSDDTDFFQWRRDHHCAIGHDVWIGHGATVMAGVSIGTGAVIGAGAVVTKDIPPYAVAVGVPAKVLRYRFAEEQVQALLALAWWDWPREKMQESLEKLNDIGAFLKTYG
ncbi:MAG: hypothetical protein JXB03_05435 [Spirochaetales bacterium]|nr:hypothetical protein [Spirochaetales bacterium]